MSRTARAPLFSMQEHLGVQRWTAVVALGVLFVSLTVGAAVLIGDGVRAILYPYELDYGEGIVWQQMRSIFAGEGYGPIDGFPAIVFHYPPLYHSLVWLTASLGGLDQLAAGRGVSLAASLVCALLVSAIARGLLDEKEGRRVLALCGAAAALIALAFAPIREWAPLMRVDMVANALTLAGLVCAMVALKRPGFIHLAAALFVGALYTKQIMLAAPAATFGVLLLTRPRLAVRGLLSALMLGGVTLLVLTAATDGGFFRHLFLYNVNRFNIERLQYAALIAADHAIWVGLGGLVAWNLSRQVIARLPGRGRRAMLGEDASAVRRLMVLVYLLLTTLMLAAVGKIGSNVNYFVEWSFVVAAFAGVALAPVARVAAGRSSSENSLSLAVLAVPLAFALQLWLIGPPQHREIIANHDEAGMQKLLASVRDAQAPVISDDMVLVLRGGKEVVWESAIFAELASTGAYDYGLFLQLIKQRHFAFFITAGNAQWERFRERYDSEVVTALNAAYPDKQFIAGRTVHSPRR